MNTIFNSSTKKSGDLEEAIKLNIKGDYIYSYPPRQAYYKTDSSIVDSLVFESIEKFENLNLYFHIPFCKQICSFCNLFAVASNDVSIIDDYFNLIQKEFESKLDFIKNKNISTLYIGGGTPSSISPKKYEKILNLIDLNFKTRINEIKEFSMEVSPETVDESIFKEFKSLGLNRINLGFQTVNNQELTSIKRKYQSYTLHKSFEIVKKIAFKNICVDLIYGLQNQTVEDWINSVETVITYSPETICIYPLTLRPQTGYYAMGLTKNDGFVQHQKYNLAHQLLLSGGYQRETNVRYIKKNGGYIQKANHWKLENILGFGAGSKNYLWHLDTRNGYSSKFRKAILTNYMENIHNKNNPIVDGFIMSEDERKRKAVILGIINLDRKFYHSLFNSDVLSDFKEELLYLNDLKLLTIDENFIALTPEGINYRDVIVQLFFSDFVLKNLQKNSL